MVTIEVRTLRSVIALTLFLFLFAVPNTMLSSTIGLKDDTDTNKDPSLSSPTTRPSYEPFNGSISIESDSEFTSENGVSSGSGTQNDPYIIENLSFEVGTVPAIRIANTTAHLVIRNLTVTGGRGFDLSSLSLNDCKNILVSGVEVSDGGTGIDIRRTSNIVIERCISLTCNIGVLADDVTDLGFYNSTMVGCKTTGSRFLGPSFIVKVLNNQAVSNDKDGMVFEGVFIGLNVTSNNASMNGNNGIRCIDVDGKDIQLSKNTLSSNLGFGCWLNYCQTLWFHNNTIKENPSGGILGEGLLGRSVNITGNLVLNNGIYGMELQGVQLINVLENRVSGHDHIGVYLGSGSRENDVVGNDISGNGYSGLLLGDGSDGNKVSGNNISHNYVGCYVLTSSDILFEGNMFEGNTDHECFLDRITSSRMVNNDIMTTKSGLVVTDSDDLDLVSNRFNGTGTVLRIDKSYGISVLDNAFHSTVIHLDKYGEVQWNLPERAVGNNIIGGPYRSGNYWGDYHGEDIDGDGIGDTDLPHGPGDKGPLVMDYPSPDNEPPIVVLNNLDLPITGKEWTGDFQVIDNRSLFGVRIEFVSYVQLDLEKNVIKGSSIEDISIDENGNFTIPFNIDRSAVSLNLSIRAIDFSGNIMDVEFDLRVLDTIYPYFINTSYPMSVDVGKEVTISIWTFDNIRIKGMYAICFFGTQSGTIFIDCTPIDGKAIQWKTTIFVPENATILSVVIKMWDHGSNSVEKVIDDIDLKDVIAPFIKDLTNDLPRTGRSFNLSFFIRDNWAVEKAILITSQDGMDSGHYLLEVSTYGWCEQKVHIQKTTRLFKYLLSVQDRSGNTKELQQSYPVNDTLPPTIKRVDDERPRTGEVFEMSIVFYDNWGEYSGALEWWYDDGPTSRMDLPTERVLLPEVPIDSLELHYRTWIEDESGNRAELKEDLFVIDDTPPEMEVNYLLPYTSCEWEVRINVSDNRCVNITWMNWSFNNEPPAFRSGPLRGPGPFIWQIIVPEMASTVQLYCRTIDMNGLISVYMNEVEVADGTPPRIEDLSFGRVEKNIYKFSLVATDNRGSITAWVVLCDAEGNEKRLSMESTTFEGIHLKLSRSRLKGYINYRILVRDSSGLTIYSDRYPIVLEGDNSQMIIFMILVVLALVIIISIAIFILRATIVANREVGTNPTISMGSPTKGAPGTDGRIRPREVVLPPDLKKE